MRNFFKKLSSSLTKVLEGISFEKEFSKYLIKLIKKNLLSLRAIFKQLEIFSKLRGPSLKRKKY